MRFFRLDTCALLALLALGSTAWAGDPAASPCRAGAAEPCLTGVTLQAKEALDEAEAAKADADRIAAYEKARDLAKQALAADDDDADAHFILFAAEGRLELLSGTVPNPVNLYKAQGRLDHVLELDPDHSAGLAAKGGLYRQLPWALGGNLDKAESFLKRAIEEDPEAIGARLELAATYLDKGQPEKCGPLIDQAVAIAEKQGKTYRLEEAAALRAAVDSK